MGESCLSGAVKDFSSNSTCSSRLVVLGVLSELRWLQGGFFLSFNPVRACLRTSPA